MKYIVLTVEKNNQALRLFRARCGHSEGGRPTRAQRLARLQTSDLRVRGPRRLHQGHDPAGNSIHSAMQTAV